jgi:serine/threonine protein kinase
MNSEEDDRTVIRPPRAPLAARTSAAPAGGAGTGAASPAPPAATQTFQATAQLTSAAPLADATMSHSVTLPPGTRLLEFEVKQTIGEGGFGIVYAAWDHSLDRRVALKEYMPSAIASRAGQSQIVPRSERHRETFDAGLKSFVNEAKLLAQFDHPSLLKVYRFWEANGTAYMVMPFLEGSTVRDTVRALAEPPDEAWIRGLLTPLFDALAMLHASQIYHRDIAPDNIHLLADTGRPLLLDFGAARRVIGDMTQALTAILKPGYAPVEQYADIPGLKQGPWTDVYALAAVVHWMITGKTPPPSVGRMFDDAHVPLAQRVAGRYSPVFLEAIDRALVVMPDKRTQSIEAFRNGLEGIAPGTTAVTQTHVSSAVQVTRGPVPSTSPPPAFTRAVTQGPRRTTQLDLATQTLRMPSRDAEPTPLAAAPIAAPRRRWVIPVVVVAALAVAGAIGFVVAGRSSTPPAASATAKPAKPDIAAEPAVTVPAATAAAPETAPAASSTAALPPASPPVIASPAESTEPSKPTQTRVDEPPAPAVVEKPPAARSRVPAAEGTTKPVTGESRPPPRKTAEPKPDRRDEPAATAHADDAKQAECARLFQRLSIGESSPELIERVRTLHCR